jgi:hypothetical protein
MVGFPFLKSNSCQSAIDVQFARIEGCIFCRNFRNKPIKRFQLIDLSLTFFFKEIQTYFWLKNLIKNKYISYFWIKI